MIFKRIIIIFAICLFTAGSSFADSFTERDRELLLKLSTDVAEMKGKLSEMDKRFDQIDKRMEQVDKRIEQVDKRIDQVDKSVNQLYTFLWILTGIFTPITLATISLLFWDRKTFMKEAKKEAVKEIEKEGRLSDLITALRELAKEDKKLELVLRKYNLL